MAAKKPPVKPTVSDAIRHYAQQNPSAKPREIFQALTAQGFKFRRQYVAAILYAAKLDAAISEKREQRRAKAVRSAQRLGRGLDEAIALINAAGSISAARQLLDAIEVIRET